MKVIAINGSPDKHGNTAFALQIALDAISKEGIQTEIIHLGKKPVRGCIGCAQCIQRKNMQCIFNDDIVNEVLPKLASADGLLFGTPVYFAGLSGSLKCFLDRTFYVAQANGDIFRHKVGAALAAGRRSGGLAAVDEVNKFIQYQEMVMPSSNYWTFIHGAAAGEAEKDEEGNQVARVLGRNFAWLLKVIAFSKGHIEPPDAETKIWTNFVR